jgi:hypothetical protein
MSFGTIKIIVKSPNFEIYKYIHKTYRPILYNIVVLVEHKKIGTTMNSACKESLFLANLITGAIGSLTV